MATAPLDMGLTLGAYEEEIIRPCFQASVRGRAAVVKLDASAMFKLAEDAEDAALAHLLNLQRSKIRAGAQRMFEKGCYREQADKLEIILTAQDID
jgi:hypothetical protein